MCSSLLYVLDNESQHKGMKIHLILLVICDICDQNFGLWMILTTWPDALVHKWCSVFV